ncbi:hypothetical protein Pcinc_043476 [Petrolisthes cinctipes]|uniref:Uncharacterized protein n=1 Tax=Petrolisthes cinctipes TaxID=88211 RepID=A0AAE1BIQ3_PETCI|nr:hypothetical protein Pcinc_043476 [Petrolisthes cinctipes]
MIPLTPKHINLAIREGTESPESRPHTFYRTPDSNLLLLYSNHFAHTSTTHLPCISCLFIHTTHVSSTSSTRQPRHPHIILLTLTSTLSVIHQPLESQLTLHPPITHLSRRHIQDASVF